MGIAVSRDALGVHHLSQTGYIEEVLERLDMQGCAEYDTPEVSGAKGVLMQSDQPLSPAETQFMSSVPYRAAVGALWYLARGTRFDIFHAVQQVSRFTSCPEPTHWRAVQRILGYLAATKNTPLSLKAVRLHRPSVDGLDMRFMGHSDSNWSMCPATSKSVSGWVVRFCGALVSWRSRLQTDIAQSTCEAEYIAASSLSNELIWWRRLAKDLGYPAQGPYRLFCDSEAAKTLSEHPGRFEATKHIRRRYHVIRQYQARGKIRVLWCPADHQWADILTKNTKPKLFRRIVKHLLGAC